MYYCILDQKWKHEIEKSTVRSYSHLNKIECISLGAYCWLNKTKTVNSVTNSCFHAQMLNAKIRHTYFDTSHKWNPPKFVRHTSCAPILHNSCISTYLQQCPLHKQSNTKKSYLSQAMELLQAFSVLACYLLIGLYRKLVVSLQRKCDVCCCGICNFLVQGNYDSSIPYKWLNTFLHRLLDENLLFLLRCAQVKTYGLKFGNRRYFCLWN